MWLGVNDVVEEENGWYFGGQGMAFIHSLAFGGAGGLSAVAKSSSLIGKGAKAVVVMGENMVRVERYAGMIGANVYKGLPHYNKIRRLLGEGVANKIGMWHNKRWVESMMKKGHEIVDIGPDFTRRITKGASAAYEMERRLTKLYSGYRKVFERFGRTMGGVPGLDF